MNTTEFQRTSFLNKKQTENFVRKICSQHYTYNDKTGKFSGYLTTLKLMVSHIKKNYTFTIQKQTDRQALRIIQAFYLLLHFKIFDLIEGKPENNFFDLLVGIFAQFKSYFECVIAKGLIAYFPEEFSNKKPQYGDFFIKFDKFAVVLQKMGIYDEVRKRYSIVKLMIDLACAPKCKLEQKNFLECPESFLLLFKKYDVYHRSYVTKSSSKLTDRISFEALGILLEKWSEEINASSWKLCKKLAPKMDSEFIDELYEVMSNKGQRSSGCFHLDYFVLLYLQQLEISYDNWVNPDQAIRKFDEHVSIESPRKSEILSLVEEKREIEKLKSKIKIEIFYHAQ